MARVAVAVPAVSPHFLWWGRKLSAANKGAGYVGGSDVLTGPERWGKPTPKTPGVLTWLPLPIHPYRKLQPLCSLHTFSPKPHCSPITLVRGGVEADRKEAG